jgi:hypothetical protein
VSRLLVTCVALSHCRAVRPTEILARGRRPLAGAARHQRWRAERVEGLTQRRTVKTEHHALLGSMFPHPPACRFDVGHPVTQGLGKSFEVEDEPYFIELQAPASVRILLTADYGPKRRWPVVEKLYGTDTPMQPDGKTRVLGYRHQVGGGAVTYLALGHCHIRYSPWAEPH